MQKLAVFTRNHEQYLEAACAKKDPSELVTFQSERPWERAKEALNERQTLKLYIAPIGSKGKVRYEATIKAISVKPAEDDPLLVFRLPVTVNEGLWGKTLYAISHCQRCLERNLSALTKEDGMPLSDNFGYSYALVHELEEGSPSECNPEEISDGEKYIEGALRYVWVNAYERNVVARQACLEHYGRNCSVCGFSFGATYGDIGTDFIHVHHLKPLSSIKKGYQVDPLLDLRPVCPNCHAMLHRKTPPYSIEELMARISGFSNAT